MVLLAYYFHPLSYTIKLNCQHVSGERAHLLLSETCAHPRRQAFYYMKACHDVRHPGDRPQLTLLSNNTKPECLPFSFEEMHLRGELLASSLIQSTAKCHGRQRGPLFPPAVLKHGLCTQQHQRRLRTLQCARLRTTESQTL